MLAKLARRCIDDVLVAELTADAFREPHANAPLRLFAAAHYLVLAGRAPSYLDGDDPWPAFRALLEEHRGWVREFVRDQPVQTNEVQRSWVLLPGFLACGSGTVDLVELGSSGGLNLVWDRYGYRYAAGAWGDAASPLMLEGEEFAPVPAELLARRVRVRRRVGVDERPVDVTTDHGATLVQSFVWPDQRERLERVRRAIDVVRAEPPAVLRGDYVTLLPELLAARDLDVPTIVFSSNSMEYLTDDEWSAVEAAIGRERERGALAWVMFEPGRGTWDYGLFVQVGGDELRRLARAHPHGRWLDWGAAA